MDELKKISADDQCSHADLDKIVEAKAERKLRGKRLKGKNVWFGMSMLGIIGWSVVTPTLLGAALGLWLDETYPRQHSWTLTLLLAGLTIGCFNAWRWMEKQGKPLSGEKENDDD